MTYIGMIVDAKCREYVYFEGCPIPYENIHIMNTGTVLNDFIRRSKSLSTWPGQSIAEELFLIIMEE